MPTTTQRRTNSKYALSVPVAGRLAFGLGCTSSYEAAKRGDLPTVRINNRLYVTVAALERLLGRPLDPVDLEEGGTDDR